MNYYAPKPGILLNNNKKGSSNNIPMGKPVNRFGRVITENQTRTKRNKLNANERKEENELKRLMNMMSL